MSKVELVHEVIDALMWYVFKLAGIISSLNNVNAAHAEVRALKVKEVVSEYEALVHHVLKLKSAVFNIEFENVSMKLLQSDHDHHALHVNVFGILFISEVLHPKAFLINQIQIFVSSLPVALPICWIAAVVIFEPE